MLSSSFKSFFIFTFALSILILNSACASRADLQQDGDNQGQASDFTVQDEIQMTKEALPEMQKDYPATKDKNLQQYLETLGNKIVRANNLEGHPYHYTFTLVETKQLNAFALPAGTVFVTRPLLEAVQTEAELAGVLGHELGHVVARHTAERMTVMKRNQKKNLLWTAGTALVGLAGGYAAGSKLCPKNDKECLAKVTLAGGALGAGASLLVQKYQYMQNSQEDELEADRLGLRFAVNAGFDPEQSGAFYQKLLALEKSSSGKQNAYLKKFSDALSTHPPSDKRVAQMKKMARNYPQKGIISGQQFKDIKINLTK